MLIRIVFTTSGSQRVNTPRAFLLLQVNLFIRLHFFSVNSAVVEKSAPVMDQDTLTAVEVKPTIHVCHSVMEARFISGVTTKATTLLHSCVVTVKWC